MDKPKVLLIVGRPTVLNMMIDAGIEVISKTKVMTFEDILAEINATDATHMVLHDVFLNGGAYRKRIEQLRRANDNINILLITSNKKPDGITKKTYADNNVTYIVEGNGMAGKVVQHIIDTSPPQVYSPPVAPEEHRAEAPPPPPLKREEPKKSELKTAVKAQPKPKPAPPPPEPTPPEPKPEQIPEPAPIITPEPEPIRASPPPVITPTVSEPTSVPKQTPPPPKPERTPLVTKAPLMTRVPFSQPERKSERPASSLLKKESAAQAAFSVTKLQPPSATVVIPVFSGNKGAGCTWLCVQIATFLTNHGMRCAVSGGTDILYFSPKGEIEQFELNDVDYYGGASLPGLLTSGYDYIVLDVGQLMGFHADHTATALASPELSIECQRAPNKYMVTDYSLGRDLALEEITKNRTWRNFAVNCTVLLTPRQPEGLAQRLTKRYQCPVYTMPVCEPFTLDSAADTFIGTILKPILNTKEAQVH